MVGEKIFEMKETHSENKFLSDYTRLNFLFYCNCKKLKKEYQ